MRLLSLLVLARARDQRLARARSFKIPGAIIRHVHTHEARFTPRQTFCIRYIPTHARALRHFRFPERRVKNSKIVELRPFSLSLSLSLSLIGSPREFV